MVLIGLFVACFFSGCVHVGGTAGYWHTDPEGGTTVKQANFDTADIIPGTPAPGKITI